MLCCALVRRPLTHEGSRKSACWVALGLSFPFRRVRSGSKTIPAGLQVRERGRGDVFAANKRLRSGLLVTAGGICGFNPLALPCRLLRARWLTGAAKDTSRVARSRQCWAAWEDRDFSLRTCKGERRGAASAETSRPALTLARRRSASHLGQEVLSLSPRPGGAQPLTSEGCCRYSPQEKGFRKVPNPLHGRG